MKACVRTCCCYFALKTGVLIIGWIFLVVFTIIFLIDSVGALLPPARNHTIGVYINKDDDNQFFGIAVTILSSSIEIITSALLIVGANEGIAKLLIPWIFTSCFAIAAATVREVVSIFLESVSWRYSLFFVLWVCVFSYFLMVVVSHYEELKTSQTEESMNLNRYRSPPINPLPEGNLSSGA